MRKKSQDELGTLVTREMKVMLQDESLTKEQRFDLLAAVMFDAPVKNSLLASFAKSLKAGFERVNTVRYKAINCHRESAKEEARRAREAKRKLADIDGNNSQLESIDINCNPLATTSTHIHRQSKNISPYKPPKGGGKLPKVVRPEDLLKAGPKKTVARRAEPPPQDSEPATRLLAGRVAVQLQGTEAFGHMRASERSLMRVLIPLAEKNSARLRDWRQEVLNGLAAWTEAWKADDWQYAPGKITKWLVDEKYLQPPRKKAALAEGSGCGECGAEIA